MYIEASQNNRGSAYVFIPFKRTIFIQTINNNFSYNRFPADGVHKSKGRFRFQLLSSDKTWSTRYNIPKINRHSNSSTQWTPVSFVFHIENYGIKLFYGQIDKALADMCFSNNSKTHSVF